MLVNDCAAGQKVKKWQVLKIILQAVVFHGIVPCVAHFRVRFYGHQPTPIH